MAYNARALISKLQSSHCQLAARATPQSSFGQLAFNVPFGMIAFCVQTYRNDNASWPFFDSNAPKKLRFEGNLAVGHREATRKRVCVARV